MSNYKFELLELCIKNEILQFGEFVLKSGRTSPYFFNAGLFNDGNSLGQLAKYYAKLISDHFQTDIMLYGPAYKGISLVASIAVQMAHFHDNNVSYAFNRKEVKDHGEGGNIVGAALKGDVVIVDDVITAGTSVHESVKIIEANGANPSAIVIALDRQEISDGETLSAVQQVEQAYKIPVLSLLKLSDLITCLETMEGYSQHHASVVLYKDRYGSN